MDYVRNYFTTTSVHGFRYLAEGSNLIERLLWICLISMAFTFASVMIGSNLQDAKEDPISVSIDTIPVQILPFPAITINAPMLDHPYRLVETVYNDVKFDCHKFIPKDWPCPEDCMRQTENIRSDIYDTIKLMLGTQFDILVDQCFKKHFVEKSSKEQHDILKQLPYARDTSLHTKYCDATKNGRLAALGVVHYSLMSNSSSLNDYHLYHFPNHANMLAKTYKVPDCLLNSLLEEFPNSYETRKVENNTCLKLTDELHSSTSLYCKSRAFFEAVFPESAVSNFRAGNALKLVRERQSYMQNEVLRAFHAIFTSNERNIYTCLFHGVFGNSRVSRELEQSCKQNLTDLHHEMDIVYKMAKQYIPPASRYFQEASEIKHIRIVKEFLADKYNYNLNNNKLTNDYAAILGCKFGDEKMTEECDLFFNTFSSGGVGYTFNQLSFWDLFKNTTSNFAFYKEFYEKEENSEDNLPLKVIDTGHTFSLEFIVRHKPYTSFRSESDQEVFMAIHDPSQVPNLKNEGIKIDPGEFYEIRINPTLTVSDSSALALEKETRNCLSKDENEELNVFKYYSQSACIFECKLCMAINACNCSSLEYPRVDPAVKICSDKDSRKCFSKIMTNDTLAAKCVCANDCEHIVYDTDMQITTFQPKPRLDEYWWANKYDYIKHIDAQKYDDWIKYGGWRKELSKVRISIQRRLATKIRRSARVSFSSQLASLGITSYLQVLLLLGGIIGLFTGMSILSVAESIYWVLKYLKHMLLTEKRSFKI